MEVKALSKHVRQTPRKLRLVAALIRGLSAAEANSVLQHLPQKAARTLLLVLKQGEANAVNNFSLEKKTLVVKKVMIGKGPTLKRGRPVSRGRWHPILKRTSHIEIVLSGQQAKKEKVKKEQAKKEKNGSKS